MTAEVHEVEETTVPVGHGEDHIDHPTPAQYWLIALILAVVTGLEVAVSYIDALPGPAVVSLLFLFGAIKFAMVVALFMHLKFDKPLYRNFFLVGLVGAMGMFIVVLLTFRAL